MISRVTKGGLTLAAIAAICTTLVAATYRLTSERIAANEQAWLEQSLAPALGGVDYEGSITESRLVLEPPHGLPGNDAAIIYRAYSGGAPVAALFVVTARGGYAGPIRILVGVGVDGTVTGVRILEHRETPGLGDGIEAIPLRLGPAIRRPFARRPARRRLAAARRRRRVRSAHRRVSDAARGPQGGPRDVVILRRSPAGDLRHAGNGGDTMTSGQLAERMQAGLWRENPGLVQLLGLCPLLAVTSTFVNGLGLGIATLVVLTCSNVLVSATRRWILAEIRMPIYVLIIASLVTCTELIFKAWFPALDRSLGIFIPLIVTNCAIVARAEVFASRNGVVSSLLDGLGMGAGFALLLMAIGFFRELVGQGSIFSEFDMLLGGEPLAGLVLADGGWLLAVLPPGAFFSLALAVALKNYLDGKREAAHNT